MFDTSISTGVVLIYAPFAYFWCGIAALWAEAGRHSARKSLLITGAGCVALLLMLLFHSVLHFNMLWLFPIFLLCIMVVPFLGRGGDDDFFWQYNAVLWMGVMNAITLTFILSLGLLAALASVNYLFGVNLWVYAAHMYAFCAMVVAPVYALFWVPRRFDAGVTDVPGHCRILVNWILVPLMAIYLLIFYAYFFKIIVGWELPKGKLSSMIAGLGCLGVVIYMMAWPMVSEGTRLLKFLHRHFFKLMLIPLLMMGVALSYRVHQYGMTEQRYMLLTLLLWLGSIFGLFLLRKSVPLKVIPALLLVFLVIASVGPLSAQAVSARSQADRLEGILTRNAILTQAGEIVAAPRRVSFYDEREISEILSYMNTRYRVDYLPEPLRRVMTAGDDKRRWHKGNVAQAMQLMGLEYKSKYDKAPDPVKGEPFHISLANNVMMDKVIATEGYRYVLRSSYNIVANQNAEGKSNSATLTRKYMRQNEVRQYEATLSDTTLMLRVEDVPPLVFDLAAYASPLIAGNPKPKVKEILLRSSNARVGAELSLKNLHGFVRDGKVSIERLNGEVVLYFK